MEIYLLLLLYVLLCGAFIPHIGRKLYLFLAFTPIIIISGLRASSVGADTWNYLYIYNTCVNNPGEFFFKSGFEPVFKMMMVLSSYIFKDEQLWFLLCSFIIGVLVAKFIYDNSDNVVMSTFLFVGLYYYLISFNAIRQYISIAVALQAFRYIKEEKRVKSFIIIVLASCIHYS